MNSNNQNLWETFHVRNVSIITNSMSQDGVMKFPGQCVTLAQSDTTPTKGVSHVQTTFSFIDAISLQKVIVWVLRGTCSALLYITAC